MSASTEEFVERIFESVLGAMDMWSIYLGEKLGSRWSHRTGATPFLRHTPRC